jgi:hypothetical protein
MKKQWSRSTPKHANSASRPDARYFAIKKWQMSPSRIT